MKTTTILIAFVVLCTLLSSCYKDTIRVSGDVTREEINLSGYSGLRVSHAFNVFVTFSDTEERIVVEANDDIQGHIIVEKDRNHLIVRLRKHTNIKGNATLNVYITTDNITYFDAAGASNITLENELVAEKAAIELSGASNFSGALNLARLDLESHGASNIDIFGNIDQFDASLSGSSDLRDYDLTVKELYIELSGASDAFLSVTESIDIDASGASSLNYRGDASVDKKRLTGASQIIKRE